MSAETIAIVVLVIAFGLQTAITNRVLVRHHKVLEWFAKHVKVNPHNIPDEMPDDLRAIVEEEADIDSITKP
jgi:hypothetical protein